MVIEPEILEKPGRRCLNAHSSPYLRHITRGNQSQGRRSINQPATFSTASANSRLSSIPDRKETNAFSGPICRQRVCDGLSP